MPRKLLLAVLSVLLTLAGVEIALRLAQGRLVRVAVGLDERLEASREAELGSGENRFSLFGLVQGSRLPDVVYELKPSLDGRFKGKRLVTNRSGERADVDFTARKPAGVVRIVGLGDSVMFGWGLAQGETYLEVLEERLAATADRLRYEVINCAVPGYSTVMEVALYEHRCRRYDPDLVLIHFVSNDLRGPVFRARETARPLASLRLARLMASGLGGLGRDAPTLLRQGSRRLLSRQETAELSERYGHMAGEGAYRGAMIRLRELAEEDDVRLWGLMTIEETWRALQRGRPTRVQRLAREIFAELGLRTIDPRQRFEGHLALQGVESGGVEERDAFWIPGDGHPSALAHLLWAEELYDAVREEFEGAEM